MLTLAEFNLLAQAVGVALVWRQAKAPFGSVTAPQAILQSTSKNNEAMINAYGVSGWSIQIAAGVLPVDPEKFDAFFDVAGNTYIVDTVVAHKERTTGVVTYFCCYGKGKGA